MLVFKCRKKLRILNQQIDDLEKEIAALYGYVKDNPGRKSERESEWLKDAQWLLVEAREVRVKVTDEVKKAVDGLNPDAQSLDLLSKTVDQISEKIYARVRQARRFEIPISYRQDKNAVDGFQYFRSRFKVMENIMNELKKPEIKMIGVHGIPGIGKTLLLREIKREIERRSEKEFDAVVMVTVSKNPNLSRIRDEIARGLGIYPFSHELASLPPGTRTRDIIKGVLIEKKVLLILDDIWTRIDLEELGIPLPKNNMACCKVLLTYRDEDKGEFLNEMGCQSKKQILPLEDEEANWLFGKIASDQSGNLSLPIFRTELAIMCKGLPIAVAALANPLKGRSLIECMTTLKRLQSSVHAEICQGMTPTLDLALRSSYSVLKNKQEFLLRCLLGRNATIRDLLNYGTGLGLFSADMSRKELWEEALALVRDSCLLLDDMNALVRDFTVAVASKEFGVFAVIDDEKSFEWPNSEAEENLKWIYITKCDMDWLPDELECPQLTFFHLSNNESSLEIAPGFFKGMRKVRVLGLTEMHFSSFPSSIRYLKDLHTLRLDRSFLEGSDIGAVIGELLDLQVLSLAGCDIKELPEAIAKLTKLEVLDLSDCCELKVIPSGVLSSLVKLEELYMGNSFDQWCDVEEHGDKKNASAAELTHLNLIALEVCIKSCNTKMIIENLLSENLQRYKVFVGDVWNYWGCSFESSNVLKLKLDEKITFNDDSVKKLLKKSDELHLEGLNGVKDLLNDLDDEGFQKLKFLLIQDAPDIQQFVNAGTSDHCNAFPILEVLVLRNLGNMQKICPVPLGDASFGKLSRITVENCDQLEYLFSFFIARHLMHLQEIAITDCKNIVEILSFREDGVRSDVEATGEAEPHKLLRSLRLKNLQKLVSFNSCGSDTSPETLFNEQVDFPRLEELQLSCINFSRIWDSPSTSYSVQNLTKLIIEGCDNLQYTFSSSLAKNLVKLKHLEISKCEMMTEILWADASGDKISFPKLNFLQITELENLTEFCSKALSIEFPSLKKLVIKNCSKFKGFTGPNVMDGVQALFNEQVSFPILESMTLSHMESVRVLWQSQIHEGSFKKLKSLEVECCGKLLYVFPSNIMFGRCLKSLELLSISQCGSLRAVFELGELDSKATGGAVIGTELRELFLSRLQRLKWVWSEDPHGILSFKKLQSVVVQYCYKLKHLFPASVAQSLSDLHNLKVLHCCGVEEIVEPVRRQGSELIYRLVFPQGTNLHHGKLRRLKYFNSGKHQPVNTGTKIEVRPSTPASTSGGEASTLHGGYGTYL